MAVGGGRLQRRPPRSQLLDTGADPLGRRLLHGKRFHQRAQRVFAAVAGAVVHGAASASGAAPQYTTDLQTFGDLLMGDGTGGGDAELLVFNPHAHSLTEGIAVPVPLCAVELKDALTGEPVPSQTTATLQISSGTAPNFDFELAFVPTLPPLSFRRFLVSPVRNAVGSAGYMVLCYISVLYIPPAHAPIPCHERPW